MKKLKFILIISLIGLFGQVKGQEYVPILGDTNVWTYSAWPWGFVDIITTEDSVYNEHDYKQILHENWGYKGLLREDTIKKQVWYIEPDSLKERIIYDFSLEEGDSIKLQWNADAMGSMLEDGWYFVDSIRTKTFFDTDRRVFYIDNPLNEDMVGFGSDRPYIEWIEGVGSNLHPTYFIIKDCAADLCEILFVYGASIICAFNNDVHIYEDCMFGWFWNGDCYESLDVEDISHEKLFTLYPNPAKNEVFVKTKNLHNEYEIVLRDLYGKSLKIIKSNSSETKIDISDLSNGIYFISIFDNENIITKKIIITKK